MARKRSSGKKGKSGSKKSPKKSEEPKPQAETEEVVTEEEQKETEEKTEKTEKTEEKADEEVPKGGKKSKGKKKKPKKEEVPEEVQKEPDSAEGEAEREEPGESEEKPMDAVNEDDEYAIVILGWATAGYDTSHLEASLNKGDKKKFKKDFERFKKGVERIEEIKKEIETLNIAGVEKEVNELLKLLEDPMHIRKAENHLEQVKKLIKAKDMEVELQSMMSVESLKGRAMELIEDLKDPENIDDVEEQMKDLRREFQEEYALNQFMELIDEKPREVKRIKVTEEVRKTSNPMVVKDIFIFTSSGKYIGTRTARQNAQDREVKARIIDNLNKAKEIIGKENITPGMSLKIPVGDETLLVHKGEHLAVGLAISGVPHKLTGKLLRKSVELMEREDADAIANWSPGSKKVELPHAKKNMKAIIYAAMKLGEEMKK